MRTHNAKPRLLCLYAPGAASPIQICRTLPSEYELSVVVTGRHDAAVEVFRAFGVNVLTLARAADIGSLRSATDGVVTFAESLVLPAAELAYGLGLPGLGTQAARAVRDKGAQRSLFARHGLPSVEQVAVRSPAQLDAALRRVGLPAVIKPSNGSGSVGVSRADNLDAALEAYTRATAACSSDGVVLVEEMLTGVDRGPVGNHASVELAVAEQQVMVVGVTDKLPLLPPFREQGQFLPARLPAAESARVVMAAVEAAQALEVRDGVLHVELKLTPAGPRIIEVNGRMGGFVYSLYRTAGICDLIAIAGQIATGQDVSGPLQTASQAMAGLDTVAFQYLNLLPRGRVRLAARRGGRRVTALPGITYQGVIAGNDWYEAGDGTRELDLVEGVRSGPDETWKTIAESRRLLEYDLETVGGVRTITAEALWAMNATPIS